MSLSQELHQAAANGRLLADAPSYQLRPALTAMSNLLDRAAEKVEAEEKRQTGFLAWLRRNFSA